MRNTLFLIAGLTAAAAYFLITRNQEPRSVDELAHKLQEAWADHHTVV